jgi:hypothetical protein
LKIRHYRGVGAMKNVCRWYGNRAAACRLVG